MQHSSIIIIDYLNIGLLSSLFKLNYGDQIYVIFHNNNSIIESILIKWLNIKGVKVNFKKLNSKKIYLSQTVFADKVASSFVKNLSLNIINDKYFINRIGKFCYSRIYRTTSIIEFIQNDIDLREADVVFIASPKMKVGFIQDMIDDKVNFYYSIGYPSDLNYQDSFRPYKLNSFYRKLFTLFVLLKRIFFVIPRSWPKKLKCKAIFHIHPQIPERHFFEQKDITSMPKSCILDNSLKIVIKGKSYNCRRLPLNKLMSYMRHIYQFKTLIIASTHLPFVDKLNLFIEWIDVFYLSEMINSVNPKIFYSNYESTIALQIQDILKRHDCVSTAATYSAGYLAFEFEFSHQVKWADIYFVWGRCLSNLYFSSGDMSNQHIIVGYIGDCFREEFSREANIKFRDKKTALIAVYDSSYNDDLFLSHDETLRFIEDITRYSASQNAKVIIKTKKDQSIYDNLLSEFPENLELISEHASMTASMEADLVIGYLSSSPVMVSAAWGKQIVFFDPYNFIWKDGKNLFAECIVKTKEELHTLIDKTISNSNAIRKSPGFMKEIDPFADGYASKRISEYLYDLLSDPSQSKEASISYANKKYSNFHGKNFIISNPNLNQ